MNLFNYLFKKIMFNLGFISINDIENEIDNLSNQIKYTSPPTKYKEGNKNTRFFAERELMNTFIDDLYKLKIKLKYYKIKNF